MEGRGCVFVSRDMKHCIGILWMLFIAGVNSTCPESETQAMNCDVIPVDGLVCSYVKGGPKDNATDSLNVPSAVESLNVVTGYAPYSGRCQTRLNVTWIVSPEGSLSYMRGFYLVMSFEYRDPVKGPTMIYLKRTFNVSGTSWTTDVAKTVFRHECVIPQINTEYTIQLFSLPQSFKGFNKTASIRTAVTASADNLCERTGDPNYTFNWTATMWTSDNPSNASIEVCFYTAPPSFNFTTYVISLLPEESNPLSLVTDQKFISVDLFQKDAVCWRFLNICPEIYKIMVMPYNIPIGTCHNGDEQTSCTATVVQSINMTQSECRRSFKQVSKESDPQIVDSRPICD